MLLAEEIYPLVEELYPICRSITGEGLRESLRIIRRKIGICIHEVPSGTQVLDWTVPPEWNVRQAYVESCDGRRLVDFADHNLHLLQYSVPVDRVVSLAELKEHLHTLPDRPDWIPYRTAYYAGTWGFCMAHRQLQALTDPEYRVRIDTTLAPGSLSYGELLLEGESPDEVLISVHTCHPSMANDNLSGVAIATVLAQRLAGMRRRCSYRFLFIPGTIGSITWLARNEDRVSAIQHGLVLTCLGDAGPMTYKQSRQGSAPIDRCVEHVLRHRGPEYRIEPFVPYGYDERQYCSPGFNLPVGCLMRTPNGRFDEYHTSADDLSFVTPAALADSFSALTQIIDVIEQNDTFINTNPKGEPQLGRRGLYRAVGGQKDGGGYDPLTLLWVLNLSDGQHSLLDIAERSGQPFREVQAAAEALRASDLLVPGASDR